jgi:phage tail sheath gpL-like
MISFDGIPAGVRVPKIYVEFNNSEAQQGASVQPFTALIMGQKLAAGTQAALTLVSVSDAAQARTLFGSGSNLLALVDAYRKSDKITDVKCIAIADLVAGVQAAGSILFACSSAKPGTLSLYIAGRQIQIGVTDGMTAAALCTAAIAAVNADVDCPVTAAVNGSVAAQMDLTARHKGEIGNDTDVRLNYSDSDATPSGVTATITAMSGGTGNPDIAAILAALPEGQFNVVVCPWVDSTNLGKLEAELLDRFGPIRQIDGYAFIAKKGTVGNLETFGNGRNSPHVSCMGAAGPTPAYAWAAAVAARVCLSAQVDPAQPVQTLALDAVLAPKPAELMTWAEQNSILADGVSTFNVVAGTVQLQRVVTMYQTAASGAADASYQNIETMFTLSYLRYDFRTTIANKYPRHKVADDGTRFAPGQRVITPKTGRAEAIGIFARWEEMGLVEDMDQFKRDLIVERNATNRDRLDFKLPPNLINQLRVVAAQIAFRI